MEKENRGKVSAEELSAAKAAQGNDKRNNVVIYLSILFAICVLLIVFSLVMHSRTNTELMQTQQSYAETMQQLKDTEASYQQALSENESLQQQVLTLGKQTEEGEKVQQALTLIWKLERLYTAGKNEDCIKVLEQLEQDHLYLYLPMETPEVNVEKGDARYEAPGVAYERIKEHLTGEEAE